MMGRESQMTRRCGPGFDMILGCHDCMGCPIEIKCIFFPMAGTLNQKALSAFRKVEGR